MVKGIAVYKRTCPSESDFRQLDAIGKSIVAYDGYRFRNGDLRQAFTAFERIASDKINAVRHADACQVFAKTEALMMDIRYTRWDRDICKTAGKEGGIPDFFHTFRDNHSLHECTRRL